MADNKMKTGIFIAAISYGENGMVLPFSKSHYFRVYVVMKGKIKDMTILSLFPKDNEECIAELKREGVRHIVAENFSPRVLNDLRQEGIAAYMFSGGPDAGIHALIDGELQPM